MACLYCPWTVLNCHLLQNHSNKTKNNLSDKIKSMFIFRSQNYKYSRASFCKLRDGAGLTVIKHFQLEFSLKWKFVPWELDFGIARIEKHQDFKKFKTRILTLCRIDRSASWWFLPMKLLGRCFSWKLSSLMGNHCCLLVRREQESPPLLTTTSWGCRKKSKLSTIVLVIFVYERSIDWRIWEVN